MKKKFTLLVFLLASFSSRAQIIDVYDNGILVNSYTNAKDHSYKVVIREYFPGDGKAHEVVDLGLSVKWATCNVGASTPYESGNYYTWGETVPKEIYSSVTDKYCSCPDNDYHCYDISHYTKYNAIDGKTVLEPSDDAATVNWGSGFRMPTQAEFQELVDECTWIWDSDNKGYLVTSNNGNSIFFPASGNRNGSGFYDTERVCNYWSSTLCGNYGIDTYGLLFYSYRKGVVNDFTRCSGHTIRPVAEK